MSMVLPAEPRTRAELLALPDDDRCRHELIDGEHIVTPAPSPRHEFIHSRVAAVLFPHVQEHRLGHLIVTAADLALGEDEVLQPDLFLVPPTSPIPATWDEIASVLLVIEIISPSTARTDRHTKRLRYQRAGVPDYWIVDPDLLQVEVWHPHSIAGELWRDSLVWPVPADAPLTIDLAALFAP